MLPGLAPPACLRVHATKPVRTLTTAGGSTLAILAGVKTWLANLNGSLRAVVWTARRAIVESMLLRWWAAAAVAAAAASGVRGEWKQMNCTSGRSRGFHAVRAGNERGKAAGGHTNGARQLTNEARRGGREREHTRELRAPRPIGHKDARASGSGMAGSIG